MEKYVIRGNIVSTPIFGEISVIDKGYLVTEKGKIVKTFKKLPDKYKDYPLFDYGTNLVLQSFSDMHLHAPQYPMLGMGMDLPLLKWLNKYTFPNESLFKDPAYARKAYQRLASHLIKVGTTRVVMFSSLHLEATLILMEELEKAGISGYVGKVNMDQNSIDILSETTKESKDNTLIWLEKCKRFKNIKPIITPRFTPSCSEELMVFLGDIANKLDLPIQSHLSESLGEIEWVKQLHPETENYFETYLKHGLWNSKTLMAHCVHSNYKERQSIKKHGVYVVHCPKSNVNLSSGIAPIKLMVDEGLNIVIGSDIAGGDNLDGFDVITSLISSSKTKAINICERPLSIAESWYIATSNANKFFGELPGFGKGNDVNIMVIDDSEILSPRELTTLERFERILYRKSESKTVALFAKERKLI